jgi:pimeloyl-ACP methyl ester carboxylesterase
MPFLERDGVRIWYEVHGPASGGGPALLLSHGYTAAAQMWKPQIEALSERRRLLLWDMRGHGKSDYPDDPAQYSEALTVGDMAAILDEVGVERAAVGGLSLGGYMSLAFHLAHPERVSALLLFDTGPGFRKDAPRQAWNDSAEAYGRAFREKGLDAVRGSGEATRAMHRNAEGLALAARGLLVQHDARVIESLPGIRVPVLVLAGAKDQPFLAAADYMAAKIPGASKVLIEGAGHAANIDAPDAFNRAVLDFLAAAGV